MPTVRTKLKRSHNRRITQEAIDAWQRGDVWGVHKALGLKPFEYSPVPRRFGAYGLPETKRNTGLVMDEGFGTALGWDGVKALQDELYALAGEPGVKPCASA
jgi:hypothetical protein